MLDAHQRHAEELRPWLFGTRSTATQRHVRRPLPPLFGTAELPQGTRFAVHVEMHGDRGQYDVGGAAFCADLLCR